MPVRTVGFNSDFMFLGGRIHGHAGPVAMQAASERRGMVEIRPLRAIPQDFIRNEGEPGTVLHKALFPGPAPWTV